MSQQLPITSLTPSAADTLLQKDTLVTVGSRPFRFQDNDSTTEDQVDTSYTVNFPFNGPGIFKGHELKPQHPNARPLNEFVSDWFTISLIALIGFFTWFRYFYYRIFKQLIAAYFNLTATNQIVRDESVLLQRASLVLSTIAYLLAGLFLYQLSVHYNWQITWLQKGLIRFVLLAVAAKVDVGTPAVYPTAGDEVPVPRRDPL